MMQLEKWGTCLLVVLASLAITGCGAHFHNETKSAEATRIKEEYAKIPPTDVIGTQRTNLQRLLAHEQTAMDDKNRFVRDRILFRLARHDRPINGELFSFDPSDISCSNKIDDRVKAAKNQDESVRDAVEYLIGQSYTNARACLLGLDNEDDLDQALRLYSQVTSPLLLGADDTALQKQEMRKSSGWQNIPNCEAIVEEYAGKTQIEATDLLIGKLVGADKKPVTFKNAVEAAAVKGELTTYVEDCLEAPVLESQDATNSGLIGRASTQYRNLISESNRFAQSVQDAKDAYKDASQTLKTALKSDPEKSAKEVRDELIETAQTVRSVLDAAKDSGDAIGLELGKAETTLESLDLFLKEIAEVDAEEKTEESTETAAGDASADKKKLDTDDPDVAVALVIAGGIPDLVQQAAEFVALQDVPAKSPLIIRKAQAQAALANARKRQAILRERVEIAKLYFTAVLEEAGYFSELLQAKNQYNAAWQQAVNAGCADESGTITLADLMAKNKDCYIQPKVKALDGVAALSDSIDIARREQDRQTYALIDTYYREATLADEFAIESWNALIATPVEQIAAYHAGGIKTDELSDVVIGLAQLIPLGFIAGRVD